jgi:hypothetical protein
VSKAVILAVCQRLAIRCVVVYIALRGLLDGFATVAHRRSSIVHSRLRRPFLLQGLCLPFIRFLYTRLDLCYTQIDRMHFTRIATLTLGSAGLLQAAATPNYRHLALRQNGGGNNGGGNNGGGNTCLNQDLIQQASSQTGQEGGSEGIADGQAPSAQ